jgi:hypothetical protein
VGDRGRTGRGRPDGVYHHVVLAGQARASRIGAEALGGGQPGRRQVGHLDPARPTGQRRRGAQQTDGAAPDNGDLCAQGPAGPVPGVDGVGGGLDQRRRLPRQSQRHRPERRRGHRDALGETAGAVHTDDLPLPAYVAQPAPALRAAAAGENGVDRHRLAPGAGPGEFVPHDQRWLPEPGAAGAVQLAAAYPGRADLDHRLAGGRIGLGDIEQLNPARRREDERLHREPGRETNLRCFGAAGVRCCELMTSLCAVAEGLKRHYRASRPAEPPPEGELALGSEPAPGP